MLFFLFALGCAFLCGVLAALVAQWHFFLNYLMKLPAVPPFPNEEYARPRASKAVRDEIRKEQLPTRETHHAFNLVLNAVFSQIRFTPGIRNWLLKKIRAEIDEMLTKTTAGHLLTSVRIRSLDIGKEIPSFSNIDVVKVDVHPEFGHVAAVELAMDIEYKGGFKLATDAEMVLGKCAALCVKVLEIKGRFRLHLDEDPYPHWSFSFLQEPVMNFEVESHFQGRPLPQITSLIINQIRRTIRKKHTYPCFKLRYKPFFPVPDPNALFPTEVEDLEEEYVGGKLLSTVLEFTKLPADSNGRELYCCIAVDDCNWVEAAYRSQATSRKPERKLHTRTITVKRASPDDIWPGFGIETAFVPDRYSVAVVITEVHPTSPAAAAGVNIGDVVTKVNGSPVALYSHDTLERSISAEDSVIMVVESYVASLPPVAGVGAAGDAVEAGLNSDGKPTSLPQDGEEAKQDLKRPSIASLTSLKKHSIEDSPFTKNTCCVPYSPEPYFNEQFDFQVEPWHAWVNVSLWSRSSEPTTPPSPSITSAPPSAGVEEAEQAQNAANGGTLIGHASLPLSYVISGCCQTAGGVFIEKFPLRAPDAKATKAKTHKYASFSGFQSQWCYGEVCLSFCYSSPPEGSLRRRGSYSDSSSATGGPRHSFKAKPRFGPQHSFVKVALTNANLCAVCGKKSWWKSGYQCQGCSVSCHRKCLAKYREVEPVCDPTTRNTNLAPPQPASSGVDSADEADECLIVSATASTKLPEIIATPASADEQSPEPSSRLSRFGWRRRKPFAETQAASEEAHLTPSVSPKSLSCSSSPRRRLGQWVSKFQGTSSASGSNSNLGSPSSTNSTVMAAIKRIGSAQSLALPLNSGGGSVTGTGSGLSTPGSSPSMSRSVPPSPNRSPTTSKKAFTEESIAQYFDVPLEWETADELKQLVTAMKSWPNQRDDLVNEVKNRGSSLYQYLPPKKRVSAISEKLQALQAAVDEASERRNLLALEERSALDGGEKRNKSSDVELKPAAAELALFIADKDTEIQAYALLMLHYCSGLQKAREGVEDDEEEEDDEIAEGYKIEEDSE